MDSVISGYRRFVWEVQYTFHERYNAACHTKSQTNSTDPTLFPDQTRVRLEKRLHSPREEYRDREAKTKLLSWEVHFASSKNAKNKHTRVHQSRNIHLYQYKTCLITVIKTRRVIRKICIIIISSLASFKPNCIISWSYIIPLNHLKSSISIQSSLSLRSTKPRGFYQSYEESTTCAWITIHNWIGIKTNTWSLYIIRSITL